MIAKFVIMSCVLHLTAFDGIFCQTITAQEICDDWNSVGLFPNPLDTTCQQLVQFYIRHDPYNKVRKRKRVIGRSEHFTLWKLCDKTRRYARCFLNGGIIYGSFYNCTGTTLFDSDLQLCTVDYDCEITTSTVTTTPTTSTAIPTSEPTDPTTSTAIPTSEPTDPTTSTAIPTSEITDPTTSTAIPTSEITDPTTSTAIPTSEPTDPTTSTAIPTSEITDPTTSTAIPTSEPTDPTTSTAIPTSEITDPTTALPTSNAV